MNDRDRFLAVAHFDQPDYVPLLSCNGIDGPNPETVMVWQEQQGAPLWVEPADADDLGPEWTALLGVTGALQRAWDRFWGLTRVHIWGPASSVEPGCTEVLADDGQYQTLRYPDGRICREVRDNANRYCMPEFVSYPLKEAEDWPAYRDRWLPLEQGVYPSDWDSLAQRWRDRSFPLGTGMPGTFSTLRELFGPVRACTLFYDEPALVHEILAHYRRRAFCMLEHLAQDVPLDCIAIGEDFCFRTGCFVSPVTFREFFTPHYREIVAFAREHRIDLVLVDSDGYTEGVVPLLEEAGINCLQAFEPRAGNDILRVRARHPHFVIWGGLDKYVMDQTDPQVIDQEIDRKVPALLAHSGYFPGIDHGLPPTSHYRSYLHFMLRLHELTGNPQGAFWQHL